LESAEAAAARRVAAAYNQARREIITSLVDRWPGQVLTPGQAEQTLRQLGILEQIDARMRQLEGELGVVLRDVVTSSSELAVEQIQREIDGLPPTFRPDAITRMFGQVDTRMVERFVPVALRDVQLGTRATSLTLQRELQVGLIQGQSFPSLVRRLMASTPTGEGPAVWANGQLSAERHVRRTVITANNASHQEAIRETAEIVPEVKKQAFAAIGKNTTDCCLRAHGQIQPVDSPFELTGTPRFADRMQYPAFHWSCRSTVAMYHPLFEQSLSTDSLRQAARAEMTRRANERTNTRQRRVA
jgi:hypothetical protein